MNETFAFGFLPSLASVIKAVPWSDKTVMWLETALDHFLNDDEREHGLRFERYQAGEQFEQWPHGRIFDESAELKWEKEGGEFHVVYCGSFAPPAGMQPTANDAIKYEDSSCYLWGSRIKNEDRIDLRLQPNEAVFAELKIPRILHYPVSAKAERVKLKVREFYNVEGALIFTRFAGLEEER